MINDRPTPICHFALFSFFHKTDGNLSVMYSMLLLSVFFGDLSMRE